MGRGIGGAFTVVVPDINQKTSLGVEKFQLSVQHSNLMDDMKSKGSFINYITRDKAGKAGVAAGVNS